MTVGDLFEELQSLEPGNLGAWPLYARVAATALAFAVVLAIGYWLMVRPRMADLTSVQAQEKRLKSEFEQKQSKAASLNAYKAQLAQMRRDFGNMLKQLPNKSEVANLLNDISQTRVASGLEEQLFKPTGEVRKDFYAELPNKIQVTGTYQELANFVSGVASLPRIVTIEDVHVQPLSGKPDAAQGQLKMNAVLTTYRYLSDRELTGKPQAAGKRSR